MQTEQREQVRRPFNHSQVEIEGGAPTQDLTMSADLVSTNFEGCADGCCRPRSGQRCCKLLIHKKVLRSLQFMSCVCCLPLIVVCLLTIQPKLSDRSEKQAAPQEIFPRGRQLYYGIVWWGKNDVAHPVVNQNTGLGQGPSEYFDRRKPTLIFIDGWKPLKVKGRLLPRMTSHDGVFMADMWIDQGWNVGTFNWLQFSDEPIVEQAEHKIWDRCFNDTCFAQSSMRWTDKDGNKQEWNEPKLRSASQLLYESIIACLADAEPPSSRSKFELRLAGHSLGGSMAIAAGYKLVRAVERGKIPAHLKPGRIALCDPYWSFWNDFDVLFRMSFVQERNITTEVVRSSAFSAVARYAVSIRTQKQDVLLPRIALSWTLPYYVDPLHSTFLGPFLSTICEEQKHNSAKDKYLLSIEPKNPNAEYGPSAYTSTQAMNLVSQSWQYWYQIGGMDTETVMDDKYELRSIKDGIPNFATVYGWVTFQVLIGLLSGCSATCLFFTCCFCSPQRLRLHRFYTSSSRFSRLGRDTSLRHSSTLQL